LIDALRGAGVSRDKVWADMKTLSRHKRWGNNIIWDWTWNTLYIGKPRLLSDGSYKRWKKDEEP